MIGTDTYTNLARGAVDHITLERRVIEQNQETVNTFPFVASDALCRANIESREAEALVFNASPMQFV